MNAPEALVAHTSERVFRELETAPAGNAPEAIAARWAPIAATALDRIMVPEENGGFGADLTDVVALMRLAGRHAVALPLLEAVVAHWLVAHAGLPERDGLLVLATPLPDTAEAHRRVVVPYGAAANHGAYVDPRATGPVVVVFGVDAAALEAGEDLAGEPRERLPVPAVVAEAVLPLTVDRIAGLLALLRAAQMQGAMEQAFAIAVEHANTRQQFGRPIGQFQAVQQMLAVVAAQVASVAAAVDGATPSMRSEKAWIGGALAKARASEAAATVNAAVHQVTAAMGFTREFPLHRFTRRLWAWRDEFGSEALWHARIGAHVQARGGAALWPFLVDPQTAREGT